MCINSTDNVQIDYFTQKEPKSTESNYEESPTNQSLMDFIAAEKSLHSDSSRPNTPFEVNPLTPKASTPKQRLRRSLNGTKLNI